MAVKTKKKIEAKRTTIPVLVKVRKDEPQCSICMGFPGPEGTHKGVEFVTVMDMGCRGVMVSYTKPDGTKGAYSIDIIPIIASVIEEDLATA